MKVKVKAAARFASPHASDGACYILLLKILLPHLVSVDTRKEYCEGTWDAGVTASSSDECGVMG